MKSGAAILLALTALVLVIFVARPIWDDILALRAESAVVADSLARFKEVESLRDQLLQTYSSIPQTDLDRLNRFLPAVADTEDLLVTIENLAHSRGIILKNVNFTAEPISAPQPVPEGGDANAVLPPHSVNYSFTISSSYESFRSFLDSTEKNLRLVDMTDISFSPSSGTANAQGVSQQSNIYDFLLKAKSYYQR
jgi:Tfp pilus assembly protein PilO